MWPAFRMHGWSQLQGSALSSKSAGLLSRQHCSVSWGSWLPPDLLSLACFLVSTALPLKGVRPTDSTFLVSTLHPSSKLPTREEGDGVTWWRDRFGSVPNLLYLQLAVITILAWTSFNFSSNINFPPQEEKENQICVGKVSDFGHGFSSTVEVCQRGQD